MIEHASLKQFSLLNRLSRSQLLLDPFPHFVIRNALDHDIYEDLDKSFPEQLILNSDKSINDRGHTKRLLYKNFKDSQFVQDNWKKFAEEHTSELFFRTLTSFFLEQPIKKYYPKLFSLLNNLKTDIRTNDPNLDKDKFVTDFQFVSNLPGNKAYTSRTPHLDNPKEIYACLFYMRQHDDMSVGGGLDLFKPRKSALNAEHSRDRALSIEHLHHTKTIHYAENTAVIFLNTRSSYHGVQHMYNQTKIRRSINIIGELPIGNQLFKI